jgi:hypothetical protein
MFLLLTGASGVGKSTVRRELEPRLGDAVRCAEFAGLVTIPPTLDLAWRQQATEEVVGYALAEQEHGRHFMLAGDPVPPGELLAAPSADRLHGIAVCLLDCSAEEQLARLTARGDPPAAFHAHQNFLEWMRGHTRDPHHRPEVIVERGWDCMCWERWTSWHEGDPRWRFTELDTTPLRPEETADGTLEWCEQALRGEVPVLTGDWAGKRPGAAG